MPTTEVEKETRVLYDWDNNESTLKVHEVKTTRFSRGQVIEALREKYPRALTGEVDLWCDEYDDDGICGAPIFSLTAIAVKDRTTKTEIIQKI